MRTLFSMVYAGITILVTLYFVQPGYAAENDNFFSGPNCVAPQNLRTPDSEFIVRSLQRVYHGGNLPAENKTTIFCLSDDQMRQARLRYRDLPTEEKTTLGKRYQDHSLRLMALRDSDADGILDFRIKELGSFMPNDPDADNDGISNMMDPRPLSANQDKDKIANNDMDRDGLPDHLDWSTLSASPEATVKSDKLISVQQEIFKQYGIVLIEAEGSAFTETFAQMSLDVLDIFAKMFRRYNVGESAKSIILADQYDVDASGVLAEVSPVNGQILVYEFGTKQIASDPRNKIAPFFVFVHEFAHVVQNAMDFPDNQSDLLKFNAHTRPAKFVKAVNLLGWTMSTEKKKELQTTSGFVDHGNEPILLEEAYRGTDLKSIGNICEKKWDNWNEDIWTEFNVVMCYSLDSVREWHAEYIATTVLTKMFNRLAVTYPHSAAEMILLAQDKMFADWGGESYDYHNADRKAVNKISRQIKLSKRLLDRLNQKYIVDPFRNSDIPVDTLIVETDR